MKDFIIDNWNVVMDDTRNPLSNIPNTATRHMIMQVLAWMWCIIFGMVVGSWYAGMISLVGHMLLLAAIAMTVATFETAKRKPNVFNVSLRGKGGEHE